MPRTTSSESPIHTNCVRSYSTTLYNGVLFTDRVLGKGAAIRPVIDQRGDGKGKSLDSVSPVATSGAPTRSGLPAHGRGAACTCQAARDQVGRSTPRASLHRPPGPAPDHGTGLHHLPGLGQDARLPPRAAGIEAPTGSSCIGGSIRRVRLLW